MLLMDLQSLSFEIFPLTDAFVDVEEHPGLDHPDGLSYHGGKEAGLDAGEGDGVHGVPPVFLVLALPGLIAA